MVIVTSVALFPFGLPLVPFCRRKDYFAGLSSVVVAHYAIFRHVVNHAGRSPVADAQCPLQERDTASAFANHDIHCVIVQIIMMPNTCFTRTTTRGSTGRDY